MMRLALFGPGHPFRGGIASTTSSLAQALQDRGHELLFMTPLRQYPPFLYPGKQDRDPDACPPVEGAVSVYAPMEPWTWARAFRKSRAFRPECVIFPYWSWAWAPFLNALQRGNEGVASVAIVHNPADHGAGGLKRRVAGRVLRRCAAFLTHAEVLAQSLEAEFPGRPLAVHLLPPPPAHTSPVSRLRAREIIGVGEGERVAIFLGLIRPYKGVDLLIRAFADLPSSTPWRLVIAGEAWGGLGEQLRREIHQCALDDRVSLRLGWQSAEEVEELLTAADLVVLPYRSGTQSAVAPLALSRGVPILSTRVGGLAELIHDGINGRLVEPGSAAALSKALESMEGSELQKLASGAAASVEDLCWDSYSETLEDLLSRVIARN